MHCKVVYCPLEVILKFFGPFGSTYIIWGYMASRICCTATLKCSMDHLMSRRDPRAIIASEGLRDQKWAVCMKRSVQQFACCTACLDTGAWHSDRMDSMKRVSSKEFMGDDRTCHE